MFSENMRNFKMSYINFLISFSGSGGGQIGRFDPPFFSFLLISIFSHPRTNRLQRILFFFFPFLLFYLFIYLFFIYLFLVIRKTSPEFAPPPPFVNPGSASDLFLSDFHNFCTIWLEYFLFLIKFIIFGPDFT